MVATASYNARVLSTPQIIINGEVWPILPNTLVVRIPGDAKVRAVSSGGGATDVVVGVDATNLLAQVSFEVANTAQNYDRIRKVKSDMIDSIYAGINIADPDEPLAFQNMAFSKDTEAHWKSDGSISCAFEGSWVR